MERSIEGRVSQRSIEIPGLEDTSLFSISETLLTIDMKNITPNGCTERVVVLYEC